MTGKNLRKIIHQFLLKFHMLKNIYILFMFQKNNSYREKQVILLMIPYGEGGWHYLAVKKAICIFKRNNFQTLC